MTGWPGIIEQYRARMPVTEATPVVTLLDATDRPAVRVLRTTARIEERREFLVEVRLEPLAVPGRGLRDDLGGGERAQATDATEPPLALLVHGFPGTPAELRPLGEALAAFVGLTAARLPVVIAASASSQISSLRKLIETAKARPGSVNYGSPGSGSTPHLAVELFAHSAGISLLMPCLAISSSNFLRMNGSSLGYSIWSLARSSTFSAWPWNCMGGWSAR